MTAFIGRFVLLISLLSSMACSAATPIAPVIVTGEGSSYWDAREDCVRQALQQSLPQLVIADRHIEDDRVVRDSVLSTMNGFVESFRVLEQSETKGSVRLKAEVEISQTDIENFVLASGKGSARISSSSLLGEIGRDDLARTSRSEILKHLFEGFPTKAFDVWVKKVEVDPINRGQIVATVEVQVNKKFVNNLKNGLRVIGRPGDSDYRSPDQLTVCFNSSSSDVDAVFVDCRTIAIDFSRLKQQPFNALAAGSMPFLLWFSSEGNSGPSAVFPSTYLRPNPYGPSGFTELPSTGREIFKSYPSQVSGGINGRIIISEAAHFYKVQISRQNVPDGAKQIHAMPLFVEMRSDLPVVVDLFEDGPSLHSTEFEIFSNAITQGDH